MSCVHCQNTIEKALASTEGVASARVSYAKGTAEIAYDSDKITLAEIVSIIRGLDYEAVLDTEKAADQSARWSPAAYIVIIIALWMLWQTFGATTALAFPLAEEGMAYGMLFVIGLITSVH
jgi:copper chaperone CopZ